MSHKNIMWLSPDKGHMLNTTAGLMLDLKIKCISLCVVCFAHGSCRQRITLTANSWSFNKVINIKFSMVLELAPNLEGNFWIWILGVLELFHFFSQFVILQGFSTIKLVYNDKVSSTSTSVLQHFIFCLYSFTDSFSCSSQESGFKLVCFTFVNVYFSQEWS